MYIFMLIVLVILLISNICLDLRLMSLLERLEDDAQDKDGQYKWE